MKLVLQGKVRSTQTIYKIACRGKFARMYMSKVGKELKEDYQMQLKCQYRGELLIGDIEMKLVFYHGDKRVRDIDNANKLVLDSMSGIIYEDDRQIKRLLIEMDYDKLRPRVEIDVSLIE